MHEHRRVAKGGLPLVSAGPVLACCHCGEFLHGRHAEGCPAAIICKLQTDCCYS
jgi:hypothetical protein